jgi:hypothetical protein
MERVTGIGGMFFRAHDPTALARWYAEHLGVDNQLKVRGSRDDGQLRVRQRVVQVTLASSATSRCGSAAAISPILAATTLKWSMPSGETSP